MVDLSEKEHARIGRLKIGWLALMICACGSSAAWGQKPQLVVQTQGSDIRTLLISWDGRSMVSGGSAVVLWDLVSGLELRTFPLAEGALALSPDNRILASGGGGGSGDAVTLWETTTGQPLRRLPEHPDGSSALAFSHDGRYLVSDNSRHGLRIWETESGRLVKRFEGSEYRRVYSLSFTPDDRHVLAQATYGSLVDAGFPRNRVAKTFRTAVWQVDSGDELLSLPPVPDELYAGAAVDPQGRYALVEAGEATNLVEVASGQSRSSVQGKAWGLARFSDDGERYLWAEGGRAERSGGSFLRLEGATVGIRDTQSGELISRLSEALERLQGVFFSPGGRYVVTAHGAYGGAVVPLHHGRSFDLSRRGDYVGEIGIWEAASGRLIRRLERQAGYFALSPDGETLVAARRSGGIGILDLASGRWIRTLSRRVPPIGGVAVSKDGRRVAAGGLRQIVIDPHPNQREAPRWRSSEPLNPVELAHARLLEEVWIWDLTNASLVQHLPAGDVLCFSDDGRLLAAKEGYKTSVWEIASGKKLQTFNTSAGLDTATFSPDGRRLYVGGGSRGRFRRGFPGRLHAWDVETGGLLWSAELSSEATGLTVDPDDPQWLVVVGSRSVGPVIDTRSGEIAKESSALMSSSFGDFYGREMRRRELSCDAFSPNGIHCAASGPGDQIRILDMASGSEVAQFPMRRDFSATGVFADDETLMIVDAGGVLWMLDISASQRLGFVPIMDEGDYVVFTEDGHYLSTGKGYSAVAVALENRAFSFEQFDLRLNRPDRVLEKLPGSDPKLRNAYLRAYQKRLEILGAREEELSESFHVPTVEITNLADLPRATAEPALRLGIRARDEKVPLAQLQLRVNGVPVLGRRGLDLDPKGVVEREVEVLLEAGQNRIQASALNAEGSESLRSTWTVEHTPDAPPPKALVLVTLGVSEFENPRMNLKYAAKDARDVAQFFSSGSPFQEVRTLTLLDRDVTRDNLPQIRRFLMNSRTGDQAMIFVASHGLLDENLDYYIASWDTDAADPAQRGIPYEELENLVDGIPARNRLILIDACHAGEVDTDKSNVRLARNSSGTVRSRGVQVLSPKRLGIESSFEMMRTLFVDLRRTTGAVVIAAANGREAALEGRDWRNGVFTYSLLQGLESGAADLDGDGAVHASELKRHVERQVVELTRGQQRPTTRRENHERDFRLW